MASDGMRTRFDAASEEPVSLSTNGSMRRARMRRIALLVLLSILLGVLLYVAYYYSQNRRVPTVKFTAEAATVQPFEYLYSFSGTDAQAMTRPTGIAIIGDRCYVTDSAFRTVRVYSITGDYLFDFGDIKDGPNTRMGTPVHLAIGPDNNVWVTDRALNALYVFDQNGKFLRKFLPNGDEKFLWSPLAIAFDPNGDMFVSDVGNSAKHQIFVFGTDGKQKAQWGSTKQVVLASESQGLFNFPNGIAIKGTGATALVFVSDGLNRRVQVFKPDGTFVRLIDTSGTPRGVALDGAGNIFVVDALAHRVDIYSETGDALANFGSNGSGPGQFSFPNDIAFNGAGRAFISDRENNQVQVWGPLVGDIPGITAITPNTAWVPFALAALILLPLFLLARRPRNFLVTPDFVDGMIAAETVTPMVSRRFHWVMTEAAQPAYEGRSAEGVDLGKLLNGEPHSESDAVAIRQKLRVPRDQSQLLAIAKRCRNLCTEDIELARFAVALGIDVYDRANWLKRFDKKR